MTDDAHTLAVEGPGGGPLTIKARSEQAGGRLTVLENVVAPPLGAA